MLLRADIHVLFDRRLATVNLEAENRWTVLLSPRLTRTVYAKIAGLPVHLPLVAYHVYGRGETGEFAYTTGFNTPGRGRYIHPSQRRVITPREAARIQGFPDSFVFAPADLVPNRTLLCKWIGDAVPSWLGYPAVLAALSGF
ncbi:MAG: hypothetical protein EXS58_12330 [Candidatus Latescibacteria bacterium]|nr:hypothetical protein [Candidatus Latescibacterota bacterium]